MHYVVLAYPEISPSDYKLIQGIRKVHDRQFAMVEPHFTVVFPTAKVSESELLKYAQSLYLDVPPFNFVLTKAIVEENVYPKYYQVHLVADAPIPQITQLHDLLYTGILESELRKDIPYVPHVTIASNQDEAVMQKLADEINIEGLNIPGKIDTVTISSFGGNQVKAVTKLRLV